MKVIITADIHNGVPNKLEDCIWSMDIIRQYATANGIENVIVCGDLFHDRVSLGIDVLNAVYDQLKRNVAAGQYWHCFVGNHDMFLKNSWDNNSLHIFSDVIQIYEGVTRLMLEWSHTFHILPFIHYESKYMEALAEIEKEYKEGDVLLTHIGVNGATLNECFLLKNWNIVKFDKSKFKHVFTGHFHCHQQVGKNVWYPGSPIPFRFDEGVVDHGFLIFDTETYNVEFINIFDICGKFSEYKPPQYLTIVDEDLPKWIGLVKGNHIRLQLSKEYTANELNQIRGMLTEKKGAKSINWLLIDRDLDEFTETHLQLTGLATPEEVFENWLLLDKPEEQGYRPEILRSFLTNVLAEAEEQLSVQEDDE